MGNCMFCDNLAESLQLEEQAKTRAAELLREMPITYAHRAFWA